MVGSMTAAPLPEPQCVDVGDALAATYVLEPASPTDLPDVVLCHGTPWSAAAWAPVARILARERRVFLWDMPGYGRSIAAAGPALDLASQGRRLADLIQGWGLDRPHVVAHDIGGAVALRAHLFEAVRPGSLYLMDIVTLDPWGSPFFALVARHHEVFAALPPALHRALVREYISGASTLTSSQVDALVEPWLGADGTPAFYRQIAALSAEHTRPVVERLGTVDAPVRIAWGTEDPWLPRAQADELAARLPGGPETRFFEGAGHLPMLESPADVALDLGGWFGRVEGRN